jgi:ketosteroid isomerase-like protein
VSSENVEIVREIYRYVEANREFPDELLADEIEWVNPPDAVEKGVRRGRDAFHKASRSAQEPFEEAIVVPDRWIDAGDQVVLLCHWEVKGRASGLERRQPQGHVWNLRDGKATSFAWFNDHESALRAAGLEPEAGV